MNTKNFKTNSNNTCFNFNNNSNSLFSRNNKSHMKINTR